MIKVSAPFYTEPSEPVKKSPLQKKDLLKAIEDIPMDAEIWLMMPYNAKPLERITCSERGIDLY